VQSLILGASTGTALVSAVGGTAAGFKKTQSEQAGRVKRSNGTVPVCAERPE